jgi:hypothetical protein
MPPEVAHHFQCKGCGYDLYTTPLDGKCPECGRRVPRRKGLDKAKNPRRVNGQLRSRLRRQRSALRLGIPLTAIVVAAALASLWFRVPGGLRALAWVFALSLSLALLEAWRAVHRTEEKLVPEPDETAA